MSRGGRKKRKKWEAKTRATLRVAIAAKPGDIIVIGDGPPYTIPPLPPGLFDAMHDGSGEPSTDTTLTNP